MKHVTIVPTSDPTLDDVLSLAEIKLFGRIDESSENDLLIALRDSAARWIEDHCNTSIGDRTAYVYLDHFYPARFPRGPVNSVSQVEYLNAGNQWTVFDPSNYWYDLESDNARIAFDNIPDVYDDAYHRVRITVNYGYPEDSVPAPLVQALRILTVSFYEGRQEGIQHGTPRTLPFGVYALTNPYRIQ